MDATELRTPHSASPSWYDEARRRRRYRHRVRRRVLWAVAPVVLGGVVWGGLWVDRAACQYARSLEPDPRLNDWLDSRVVDVRSGEARRDLDAHAPRIDDYRAVLVDRRPARPSENIVEVDSCKHVVYVQQ